jgi:hypothetical protein
MTNEERDIQRKLRVLQHAEKIGNARKACRYFGVGRSSFYRWREAYQKHGEAGLKNAKSVPKNPANQTPAEIVGKVLYLRRKYHLGSIRIVWYLFWRAIVQYGQAPQRLRIPAASAQEHRPDRPKTDYALTFKLDHPMGAHHKIKDQLLTQHGQPAQHPKVCDRTG